MAGHSKWANIKHKKAKEDAKKGKVFTKLTREITVVAREGGGDPDANARLRLLLEKARAANMPSDNVSRAIKKGTGELEGASYESILYEGYGPCGVAVMIETLTDNRNRTVSDVRHVFTKMGGNMGENGVVSWMFAQKGVVSISDESGSLDEDQLLESLIEHGLEEVEISEDNTHARLVSDMTDLIDLKAAADSAGLTVDEASLEWVPSNRTEVSEGDAEKVYKFLDKLEELDDVQNVYANIA